MALLTQNCNNHQEDHKSVHQTQSYKRSPHASQLNVAEKRRLWHHVPRTIVEVSVNYQLLSPEEEIQQIYPYRRVWRSLIIELGIMFVISSVLLILITFEVLSNEPNPNLHLILAVLPLILFGWFSVRAERRVYQPRRHLLSVLALAMVLANGVAALLLEELYTPERWLPQAGFFSRIFGYMATAGILSAFIQYGVIRYTVWPAQFRLRLDGVAYAMATAIGYATVFNLRYILFEDPLLSAAIIRILATLFTHVLVGVWIGYFLGEFAIGRPPIFWMPLGLGVSSFLFGIYMAFRSISVKSGFNVEATGDRPIGPYLLATGLTAVSIAIVFFLIESADERMANRAGVERIR